MAPNATYYRGSKELIRTAATALNSGDIVPLEDGRVGVVQGLVPVVSGDQYAAGVVGIYNVAAASGTTFALGVPVFYNTSTDLAVNEAATLDGATAIYLGVCAKAKVSGETTVAVDLNIGFAIGNGSFIYEFDTETGVDATAHTLIPASRNPTGLIIEAVYGVVTEVFGGASEDQGIVTVRDSALNVIATLTPSNAGADAVNDIVVGTGKIYGATTGDAIKTVAAGLSVQGIVTQATSGASAAGRMKVYVKARPLA
jgi:uncharacterized protein DUF2190